MRILDLKVPWKILLMEVAATLFATCCLDLSSTMFFTLVFATEGNGGKERGMEGRVGKVM